MGGAGELIEKAICPTPTNCWNSSRLLVKKLEAGPLRVMPKVRKLWTGVAKEGTQA